MHSQDTTVRTCRRCKLVLPLSEFGAHKITGRSFVCVSCRSEIHRSGRYKNCPDGHKQCRFCKQIKEYAQFPMMAVTGIKRNTLSSACFGCNDAKKKQKKERHKDGPSKFPSSKVCGMCHVEKPIGHFRRDTHSPDWRKTVCMECVVARDLRDPSRLDYRRRYHLAHKYGLEIEDVSAMVKAQDGLCGICSGNLDFSKNAHQRQRANIDHCHTTGKIRGLLCNHCNVKLGTVESPGFLVKALEYLKKHGVDPLAPKDA